MNPKNFEFIIAEKYGMENGHRDRQRRHNHVFKESFVKNWQSEITKVAVNVMFLVKNSSLYNETFSTHFIYFETMIIKIKL